jgi:hypothetical protein
MTKQEKLAKLDRIADRIEQAKARRIQIERELNEDWIPYGRLVRLSDSLFDAKASEETNCRLWDELFDTI